MCVFNRRLLDKYLTFDKGALSIPIFSPKSFLFGIANVKPFPLAFQISSHGLLTQEFTVKQCTYDVRVIKNVTCLSSPLEPNWQFKLRLRFTQFIGVARSKWVPMRNLIPVAISSLPGFYIGSLSSDKIQLWHANKLSVVKVL